MKILLLAFITLFTLQGFAGEPTKEEMMKKWEEFSTPAEAHKFLSSLAGKWTYTQKMWETKDAKPEESSGRATMKMIMGGRFLQQEIKGKAMGQNFEGLGFTGYDNVKKRTVSTWMDNMGTSILYGIGDLNLEKKTITEEGAFTCPMEKDQTREYRSELVSVDKNTVTFMMFHNPDGKGEVKMMEMVYKRSK